MKSGDSLFKVGKDTFLKAAYDAYYHRLCFYALKYLVNTEDVQDIVQEVFVNLWERDTDFENEYALSAFLYKSVYNACINCLTLKNIHHRHHQKILELTKPVELENYVTGRIEDEVWWEIFSAIDSLPSECRKIFKLSYLEDYDLQKVAEELNISVHTVKSQRARAKKLLQDRLKDLFPLFAYFSFPEIFF